MGGRGLVADGAHLKSPMVLWHLLQGTLRFNDIRCRLSNVTPRMLTNQLRELEMDGFGIRTV
mgnify:FL=1